MQPCGGIKIVLSIVGEGRQEAGKKGKEELNFKEKEKEKEGKEDKE